MRRLVRGRVEWRERPTVRETSWPARSLAQRIRPRIPREIAASRGMSILCRLAKPPSTETRPSAGQPRVAIRNNSEPTTGKRSARGGDSVTLAFIVGNDRFGI